MVRHHWAFIGIAASLFAVSTMARSDVDVPVATHGGELQLQWNQSLLQSLNIRVTKRNALGDSIDGFDRFELRPESTLSAVIRGQGIDGIRSSSLYVTGGYLLVAGNTQVNFDNFVLFSRNTNPPSFVVRSQNGETLFFADKIMAEPTFGGSISIRTMDLRIDPSFAGMLHNPAIGNWVVARVRIISAPSLPATAVATEPCPESSKWDFRAMPVKDGHTYGTDVFMQNVEIQQTGCRDCGGPNGLGIVKITPTTAVRNNANDGSRVQTVVDDENGTSDVLQAADIPWREMFSSNCPPYGNDQHPFLTWNLYEETESGELIHIARSGVKHSHIAENGVCLDNPRSNHVLGRGCVDVYGTADNDAAELLGPRSEILPHRGIWARCGSIYDPKCSGRKEGFKAYDEFAYRLAVPESILSRSLVGEGRARLFLEAWYVIRDAVNPYHGMATVPLAVQWSAANHLWSIGADAHSKVGPLIDRWATSCGNCIAAMTNESQSRDGRLKLAVHVRKLPSGRFKYDYEVMNVDFVDATTSGNEPNLRLKSSHGITSISLRTSPGSRIADAQTHYLTGEAGKPWQVVDNNRTIDFLSPQSPELTWATTIHFSFTSVKPPSRQKIRFAAHDQHTQRPPDVELLGP